MPPAEWVQPQAARMPALFEPRESLKRYAVPSPELSDRLGLEKVKKGLLPVTPTQSAGLASG